MMITGSMFYNRKPETGAADFLRMTLIDSIETFEYTLLIFRSDPNPCIDYLQSQRVRRAVDHGIHSAALFVIFNRIITKILTLPMPKAGNSWLIDYCLPSDEVYAISSSVYSRVSHGIGTV